MKKKQLAQRNKPPLLVHLTWAEIESLKARAELMRRYAIEHGISGNNDSYFHEEADKLERLLENKEVT